MDILASILQVQNTLKIGDNTDYTNVFTDSNGWLNFSPTGSHTICNGRLGGSDVLLQWAGAGYGGGIGVSYGDYQGPRTLMEMFYSLSSAPNVPDVFRYKTIIDAQKYDGAWLTDTLDWTGLLTPNNSTTTAITYAENQAGFTAKRFTVDIGASWNRSNLIALQAAYSGGQPAFVLKIERSVNNSSWTTIFDSTVSGNVGLAYVLQNDAADNRYFRFTVTLVSSLGVGVALAFSKLIGFNARLYGGSSLQPFVTDYSRNTTFNGHLLFASGKYLQVQDGSASAASLSFASETNTGMYRVSAGLLGFTTSGTQRASLSSSAFTLASGVALSVASSASLNSLAVTTTATIGSTLSVTGATTLSSTLAVTGIATFSNEVVDWSSYSAIHFGTVDTFWEATQRLQAQADTSSTTCMELEVMTPAAAYGGVARITRWQINTRGAIYVSRYEENGGAGNCTLRILSDNSKANVTTVRDRFVVGVTFSDTFQMAYMRVRYTNGTNGRWSTLIAKATSTPTTVSGSSMTYSSGWIANTGYTVEAFTENIVNGKFGTLNLTGTLTGVAATLSGTATLSGDLAVRSTALVVGSRGTSVTTALSLSPSTNSNEGGFKVVTNMTDTAAYHKIGIWNEYYLSGSGHSATQRTAIWNTVSASSADTFASIAGQYMYLNVGNASGVVTSYSAFIISAPQGSGTVTSHIGLNLADISSGSVGAAYGIYSAMGTTGGTRYFIYQAGAAPSYFRGQILGYASDSSSAPSYSWLGDLTTGLYRISAGNIGLSGSFSVSSNLAIGSTAAPGFPLDIRAAWSGYRQSVRIFNTQTAATGNGSDILFDSNRTTGGATTTAAIRSGIHDIDNTNYKGHLIFMTADGAYPTERLRINHKGHLIFPELTADPTTTDLTAAGSYNENNLAIYCKNNKLVIAYNDGNGIIRYITIPLNGTTTTWTHSDATP